MDGAGENLGGRGTAAIHEDGERAIPENARLRIIQHFSTATSLAELHHGAFRDEQANEAGRFRQQAATIAAQVQH